MSEFDFWEQNRDAWDAVTQVDLADDDLYKWQEMVLRELQETTNKENIQTEVSEATREAQLTALVAAHKEIPLNVRRTIVKSLLADMFSFGPLQGLWSQPKISDMQVFVPTDPREKQIITYSSAEGRRVWDGAGFRDYSHAMTWLNRHLAQYGQHYDAAKVSMDAVFPSGERMHVISGVSGYSTFTQGRYKYVPCVIITMRRFTSAFTLKNLTVIGAALQDTPQFDALRHVQRAYTRKTLYTTYDGHSLDQASMDYLRIMVQMAKNHIIAGGTGCHDADAPILMYDGSTKRAADVQVGDQLMGMDSTPRNVLDLHRGVDRMVKVIPKKGEPFIVNEGHILSLKKSPCETARFCETENISIREYGEKNTRYKQLHYLWRTGVEFPPKKLPIDPYILGVLLGDGSIINKVIVINPDEEVVTSVLREAENRGLNVNIHGIKYRLVTKTSVKSKNSLINDLRTLGLFGKRGGDKFIPEIYKTASRHQRLELLAGLLDTDGYKPKDYGYVYSTISLQLAKDVQFLARSLGFNAQIKKYYEDHKKRNGEKIKHHIYALRIGGNIAEIPLKVERKKAAPKELRANPNITNFSVEPIGYDHYFGWEVDGDHMYLDGQFIVHHNSGKSTLANALTAEIPSGTILQVLEESPELQPQNDMHVIRIVQREGVFELHDAMKAALRQYPDRIFIAELRDTLAFTFLRAIQSGQDGSSTTIHSNSCLDAIDVLINFAANHDSRPPREMIRDIVFRRVHTLIHANAVKKPNGIARMIDEIVELQPDHTLHTVMQFHQVGINTDGSVAGYFEFFGPTDSFMQEMFDAGIEIPNSWGWT